MSWHTKGESLHLSFYRLVEKQNCKLIDIETPHIVLNNILEQQWVQALGPNREEHLDRRISWSGFPVNRASLNNETDPYKHLKLRNETSPALIQTDRWVIAIKRIQAALGETEATTYKHIDTTDGELLNTLPFVHIWLPIQHLAREDLIRNLNFNWPSHQIDKQIIHQLVNQLIQRLCEASESVLWNQFCQGRRLGHYLDAYLQANQSDKPKKRISKYYDEFISHLVADRLEGLFKSFPVYARIIGLTYSFWLENASEMLNRIHGDLKDIFSFFGLDSNSILNAILCDLGDQHNGSRSVSRLEFNIKKTKQVVIYKPKSIDMDELLSQFISQFNLHSKDPPLKTALQLNKHGYGYSECINHQLCKNEKDLADFYWNAGQLTAILHLLGCSDCHHENLIAHNKQLVLIDAETLLEPILNDCLNQNAGAKSTLPTKETLDHHINESVLRTGLLPCWIFTGNDRQPYDISALGMPVPQESITSQQGWKDINSDCMRYEKVDQPSLLPTCSPVGIGTANQLPRYQEQLCNGFLHAARKLLLMKQQGAITFFVESLQYKEELTRRIVIRPTKIYQSIKHSCHQASSLESNWSFFLCLEKLAVAYLLTQEPQKNWPCLAEEILQLDQLDIPIFSHTLKARDLVCNKQGNPIQGFFAKSSLDALRDRIKSYTEKEINFQAHLIRGTINARQLENLPWIANSTAKAYSVDNNTSHNSLKTDEIVCTIAQKLLEEAYESEDGELIWLDMDLHSANRLTSERHISYGPIGLSLYGGSLGVACLFAEIATQDSQHKQKSLLSARVHNATQKILQPFTTLELVNNPLSLFQWWRDNSHGLTGCGGVILSLNILQSLGYSGLNPNRLIEVLNHDLIRLNNLNDIMGGAAGLIGPLLATSGSRAIELACLCGDHLLEQQTDDGSWIDQGNQIGLLGFSHGTSGIMAALAQLHRCTGDWRYHDAACKALQYERNHFNSTVNNWPDLRQRSHRSHGSSTYTTTWCHGAPGIALSRACLWGTQLWDEPMQDELAEALLRTASLDLQDADHLCCGSTGRLAILQTLLKGPWPVRTDAALEGQKSVDAIKNDLVQRCSNNISTLLTFFGTRFHQTISPGLFTGHTGIAYALIDNQQTSDHLAQLMSSGLLHKKSNHLN